MAALYTCTKSQECTDGTQATKRETNIKGCRPEAGVVKIDLFI